VTPFDPWALLAMLLSFYPAVSVAALTRARAERPEYFAGGRLGGSKGEKLYLPDGRVWDLIFAAGGPPSGMRWQVLDVTDDPGGPGDGFELEPGPLSPLDEALVTFPPGAFAFESFVAGELAALDGADGVLHQAGETIVAFDGAAHLEGSYDGLITPALAAHVDMRAALDQDNPIDELEAAENAGGVPAVAGAQYDDDPPTDIAEPDPGSPPSGGGDPGDPGQPQV